MGKGLQFRKCNVQLRSRIGEGLRQDVLCRGELLILGLPLQGDDEVLILLYKGVCVVVVLLRSGSKGFVRCVEVDEARALLASVLRASPGGGGRGCSVFAEIVGESICVEKLLGTTLSDEEFAEGDHNDKSIIL